MKKILPAKSLKSRMPSIWSLTIRQLLLKPWKNAGIIILLAIGVLVIIITGANYRNRSAVYDKTSGTGGFLVWAEASVPLPASLPDRLTEFGMDPSDNPLFRDVSLFPLPEVEQDDASCLNLNMVINPTIIGIPPDSFDGRFTFVQKDVEWSQLERELSPGIIRGFADATVLKWGMHAKTGDTVFYNDEKGNRLGIVISGALENSIFQGNIIISDSLLKKYYPSALSKIMVISGDPEKGPAISDALEQIFSPYGLMATTAAERLSAFDAVQNTYLSVFLILGGLGILLATAGLGIFFVRETSSRMREFSILNTLGFSRRKVILTGTAGYFLLLISGISFGVLLAFVVIVNLSSDTVFSIIPLVKWLIIAIFFNGIIWIMASLLILVKRYPLNSHRLE